MNHGVLYLKKRLNVGPILDKIRENYIMTMMLMERIDTNSNLSRVLFVAPSVWKMIYSRRSECAF